VNSLAILQGRAVQRVAFGAEQLGGFEWGQLDIGEIESAVVEATRRGRVFVDTADCYGRGESERRLGNCLGEARSNVYLATKFGVRFDAEGRVFYDNGPDYAEAALEASLKRLGTAHVDLLQVHWPDKRTPLPLLFERLERMREAGRIRAYGVCNFPYSELLELPGQWPGFATFSGQFSMLQCAEHAIINEVCRRRRLTFLSWGSLGQGLLSGKYNQHSTFGPDDRRSRPAYHDFHGKRLARNLRVVERLNAMSAISGGHSSAQLAIRFVLEVLPSSIAIVGVKSRKQFNETASAAEIQLAPVVTTALNEAATAPECMPCG
jgi:aryl-alcohol dehydrogenase-like predicted oxidoreductase